MKSLTHSELYSLLAVARRHSERDWLMLYVTFSHGLRVSEVVGGYDKNGNYRHGIGKRNILGGYLVTHRLKGSRKTTQPLLDNEREALQRLAATCDGEFFPMSRQTFWRKMQAYGAEAGIPQFKAHPHALRHSAGRLGFIGGMQIPDIQKYLGHISGANTLIYLESSEEEACGAFAAAVGL
jgi:integrase